MGEILTVLGMGHKRFGELNKRVLNIEIYYHVTVTTKLSL